MNCLLCGQKLAIFRRLSLGDFCSQEHRALFLREQSDQGLARLIESKAESQPVQAATRVYAQFLPDEVAAAQGREAGFRSHGPLAHAQLIAPEAPRRFFSQLAPAKVLSADSPAVGVMTAIGFEFATPRPEFPTELAPVSAGRAGLSCAGLILPWAGVAGSHTAFSLAPLVAAAWARSGFSQPMASEAQWIGKMQFVWPRIEGTVEVVTPSSEIPTAAFAAVETPAMQPMRVRLSVPPVAPRRPKLAMPAPAPMEEDVRSLVGKGATPTAPKPRFLDSLFPAQPSTVRLRRDVKRRQREEIFGYNEPAPTVSASRGSWAAMFAGLAPSTGLLSAAFALLFVVSAVGILFTAPSALPGRPGSFSLSSLRSAIRNRAVLKVEDDFRSGLNHWIGPSGWSKDWSLDQAGFLRPGKLGFLQQSMNLVNYRMEFMGQIDRKSLGWAFRAKDDQNYYVAKLTVARPGPLPMVDLIRYAVTNGKEGSKTRISLPFAVRNDTLYQIEMNVLGDHFRASVNGHVVDSWSDNRLRAGGVGFVGGQGEASRVRWIRVSDRDDVIGRFCSYLSARYEPSNNGVLSASSFTILRPISLPSDF